MTGMSLREAALLIDELAREVADLLPVAAVDADVELVLDSKRDGDDAVMVSEQLVLRLVHAGWSFTSPTPEEPAPTTPEDHPADTPPVRHELRPEAGTQRPMCVCGYKPGPPEATSATAATELVIQHIQQEQRKRPTA